MLLLYTILYTICNDYYTTIISIIMYSDSTNKSRPGLDGVLPDGAATPAPLFHIVITLLVVVLLSLLLLLLLLLFVYYIIVIIIIICLFLL